MKSFSLATCAAEKIPLRLQVWNLRAIGAQILRAADCKPFVGKPHWGFPTGKKTGSRYGSRFLLLCARYATSSSGASAPRAFVCSAAPRTAACTSATDTPCARATDSSARRASSSVVGRVTCFFLSCVLRLVCPGGRGLIRSPSECARQRCERRAQRHAHRRRQQRRQQCPFCAAGLAPDGPERRRARPVQQEK